MSQSPESIAVVLENRLEEIAQLAQSIETFLEGQGASSKTIYAINLALDELLTNIISYGFGADAPGTHKIAIDITVQGGTVEARVEDDGCAFNPLEVPEPDLDADIDERRIGGLGIYFILTLMDRIEYQRTRDRNIIVLSRALDA